MSQSHFGRRRHRANVRGRSAATFFNGSFLRGRFSTVNMPPSISQPHHNGVCHANTPDRKALGSAPRHKSPYARFPRMPEPITPIVTKQQSGFRAARDIVQAMMVAANRSGDGAHGAVNSSEEARLHIWGACA
jgi:hypothetical protein